MRRAFYATRNKPQSEMTASPSKYPQGFFKEKPCKVCSSTFKPMAPSHMHCSQECADIGVVSAYLMRCYKIDYDQYERMYLEQGGVCKICGGESFLLCPTARIKLVVDHCHATGVVRGLLCHNCNRGLGLFQDSQDSLEKAVQYLKGATTIPSGSTSQANGDGNGED